MKNQVSVTDKVFLETKKSPLLQDRKTYYTARTKEMLGLSCCPEKTDKHTAELKTGLPTL